MRNIVNALSQGFRKQCLNQMCAKWHLHHINLPSIFHSTQGFFCYKHKRQRGHSHRKKGPRRHLITVLFFANQRWDVSHNLHMRIQRPAYLHNQNFGCNLITLREEKIESSDNERQWRKQPCLWHCSNIPCWVSCWPNGAKDGV